jgi:hypothetical protein
MLQPKKKIVKNPVDGYKKMKDPATGKKGTMGGEGTRPPFEKGEKRAVPNPMEMARKNAMKKKAKNGKSFPDLNKDGKITKADILKGRGVIAKKGATIKKAQTGARTPKDIKTAVRMPKQLEQKGKPDARNSGLAIDTTSIPKGFKSVKDPSYKPSTKKYKSGGSVKKCKYGCK